MAAIIYNGGGRNKEKPQVSIYRTSNQKLVDKPVMNYYYISNVSNDDDDTYINNNKTSVANFEIPIYRRSWEWN